MAEFIPINTQEEFDAKIKDRLERERTTATERAKSEYAEKLKELDTLNAQKDTWAKEKAELEKTVKEKADSIDSLNAQLKAEQGKVQGFEKENLRRKVAIEAGLPETLAGRLQGETEDEMKEDAKSLVTVFKTNNNKGLPMANLDNGSGAKDKEEAAYKGMLSQLKQGE